QQRRAAAGLRVRGRQVRLVHVAQGGGLAVLVDQEGVEQLVAAVADADEPQPHPVVRPEGVGVGQGRQGGGGRGEGAAGGAGHRRGPRGGVRCTEYTVLGPRG